MAQIHRLAGEPGGALDRASAGANRGGRATFGERRRDAPPARPRPIFEVRILTKVGIVLDLFDQLIGAFVALVAVRYGKLGPFLEVDDERDGDARAARPSDFRRAAAMAAEIAFGNACHVGSPVAKQSI